MSGLLLAQDRKRTPVPDRLEINLADVRWQPLPAAVRDVYVGPDQRAWYVVRNTGPELTLDQLKARVASEFGRPDPQIPEPLIPALFEPGGGGGGGGGRVWFVYNNVPVIRGKEEGWDLRARELEGQVASRLLGYDGKSWIEYDAPEGHFFNARAPGHGRDRPTGTNLFAAGRAFFGSQGLVHCYDGRAWTTHRFWTRDQVQRTEYTPILHCEPDGQGVVAQLPMRSSQLWRWRDGKWTQLPLPGVAAEGYPLAVAATSRGAWVHYMIERLGEGLVFVPTVTGNLDDLVRPLVARLGDDDFPVRDEATRSLIQLGKAAEPALRAARERSTDAEVRTRIESVLAEINRPAAAPGERPMIPAAAVGGYTVDIVHFLFGDGRGNVVVAGRKFSKDGRDLGAGVVYLNPAGRATFVGGERAVATWRNLTTSSGMGAQPLVVPDPDRFLVWTTGDQQTTPASLIDLPTREVLAALPDAAYPYLHAAKADGTLFANSGFPYGADVGPIMVYRPAAATDNVATLKVDPFPIASVVFAIASDGCAWAHGSRDNVLCRFDGTRWHVVDELARGARVEEMIPGAGGSVLVSTGARWTLYTPGKDPVAAATLTELIENRHEAFTAAQKGFSGGLVPNFSGTGLLNRVALQADRFGNVWVLTRDAPFLRVFSAAATGKWLDPGPALRAAGSRRGYAAFVRAVGDGSKVYVSDFSLRHDGGRSFLIHVQDGNVVVARDAPHVIDQKRTRWPVVDSGGGLWLPAADVIGARTNDLIRGYFAVRMTEDGPGPVVKELYPLLADRGGNVWLADAGWYAKHPHTIWRDGGVAGTLRIDSTTEDSRFVSDRPGSVWAWTKIGLRHFVEDPAKPGRYEAGKVYTLPGFSARIPAYAASPLGFLTAVRDAEYRKEGQTLYLIHLKDARPAAQP